MPTSLDDPSGLLRRLSESYKGIKFGRGVVGKTSYATLALFGLWGVILFRLSENLWLDALLLVAGIIATGVYFWWVKATQKFAKENPSLALLEGAETQGFSQVKCCQMTKRALVQNQSTKNDPIVSALPKACQDEALSRRDW